MWCAMPRSDFEVCWYLSPVRVPDAELWQPRQETTRFWVSAKIRALVFWNPPVRPLTLEELLHEKVKEKLQSIWFIRQAWSCLYVLSSFQALHLQYVFTYIIGITSRLVPLSISTKPCGLHDSKITPQIPCLFQRTYMERRRGALVR